MHINAQWQTQQYPAAPTRALQQLGDAGLVKRQLPLNLLLLRQRHICAASRCGEWQRR